MKEELVGIILQNIEFLCLSSDADINPDAAVRQLEVIASLLKELSKSDIEFFFEQVSKRVEVLRNSGASEDQVLLLKNLRDQLGI